MIFSLAGPETEVQIDSRELSRSSKMKTACPLAVSSCWRISRLSLDIQAKEVRSRNGRWDWRMLELEGAGLKKIRIEMQVIIQFYNIVPMYIYHPTLLHMYNTMRKNENKWIIITNTK